MCLFSHSSSSSWTQETVGIPKVYQRPAVHRGMHCFEYVVRSSLALSACYRARPLAPKCAAPAEAIKPARAKPTNATEYNLILKLSLSLSRSRVAVAVAVAVFVSLCLALPLPCERYPALRGSESNCNCRPNWQRNFRGVGEFFR